LDDRVVLPVNTVLDGAYRILRVVGSGGFGITYEAEDIRLQAKVAIKEYYPADFGMRDASMVVRPKSVRHKETFDWGRANFVTEAQTLARFEHPSIVRVSRVFEINSTAYMVMRFEQGRSFESWLRALDRPPTQAELDGIVAPLLDALQIMHAQHFLHRDIAPDNIIIRTDGSPVLLDFGSARRAVAARSRALTGIVKAGYSPQEQYATDGRLQGPWSDFYALGGTLYRAVTGRVPEEATIRVSDDRTPPVAAIAMGTYRPGFLAAIDACLKVKYSERPQSVAQLRPLLFGPAPQARSRQEPPPRPRSDPKPTSQVRPKPASKVAKPEAVRATGGAGRRMLVVASLLLILAGVGGGYTYQRWHTRETLRISLAEQSKVQAEKRAEEQRRTKAEEEERRKANLAAEEKKRKEEAEAEAIRKAEEDAAAKREAEAEARRKAERVEEDKRREADQAAARKREEQEAARARADAEARRKSEQAEQEARRKSEAAAAKKAEEEQQAKARADAEARRKSEQSEQERRRQDERSVAAFDGVWEITRVGSNCATQPPMFGVTIVNGSFAQGFGTVSSTGEFRLLGRSQTTGPRDLQYTGRLVGTGGSGTFQADRGACSGTFTAKRRRN
jgi:serine/threonine protein kinase